jgi:Yip1 domain
MADAAPAAPSVPGGTDSALGRLLGVFVSPVHTLAAIAARPTWVLPMAIAAGLTLPVSELILSKTDWRATMAQRMEKGGRRLSEAQMEAAVQQMRKLTWLFDIFAVAVPILVVLAVAGGLWAACQAFGWEVRFRQSLGVASHAFLPGVLASVGLLAALWNRATIDPAKVGDVLHTNLGFLADAHEDSVVHGLLASVDLFSFWTLVLLVLGLSAAAKTSRGRMAALVVTLWGLFVLGKAGVNALTG